MAKYISDRSVTDLLLESRNNKKTASMSTAERRESEAARIRKIDAKSHIQPGAYSHIDARLTNRTLDMSRDNRDAVIKRASLAFKDRVASSLGKGGITVDYDGIEVQKVTENKADPTMSIVDKALVTFGVKVETPTKPMTFYGAVDYDDSKDRHSKYAIRDYIYTPEQEKVALTDAGLRQYASKGKIQESNYTLDRKLVAFDMSHPNPLRHSYVEIPVTDVETARGKLKAHNFRVASKYLGTEAGSLGHVYEVVMLPSQRAAVKKILANEWKDYSREPHNDEGKSWSDATESTSDFSGRSREKNKDPHQTPKGKGPHQTPHSDEDKAMSDEAENAKEFPGRTREKNDSMLPPKKDVDRKVKNDEFDGNHMTDDRTEKATEFPGRTMEKGVAKEANPKDMLRWERKKAQGTIPPPPGGGMPGAGGGLPPVQPEVAEAPAAGPPGDVLPGSSDESEGGLAPDGMDAVFIPEGAIVTIESPLGGEEDVSGPQMEAAARRWALKSKKRTANLKRYALDIEEADMYDDEEESDPIEDESMDEGLDVEVDVLDIGGEEPGSGGDEGEKVCDVLEGLVDLVDDPDAKSALQEVCDKLRSSGGEAEGMPDESEGMMKFTEDEDLGLGDDLGLGGDDKAGMGMEGMGSMASYAEFRGRRVAKFIDYLGRKGYRVAGGCHCTKGSNEEKRCVRVGCSNNPACNTSRGLALITAEKAGKADMLKAKSHPTPDVDDKSRPMDGMHKRDHEGGEKVVPSERAKSESGVKKK